MTHDTPQGRYGAQGDLYLDIPESLIGSPLVVAFLLVLERNFPSTATKCDGPFCRVTTVWAHWRHAARAEGIARLFWPDLCVQAVANPAYSRASRDLPAQLATARKAIVAAESAIASGVR